jgi:hypothetical protein
LLQPLIHHKLGAAATVPRASSLMMMMMRLLRHLDTTEKEENKTPTLSKPSWKP